MRKNVQHIAILLCALLLTTVVQAQVKVGDNPTTINPSAVLEIESTNKGLLLPRVTLSSTTNFVPLATHVEGMVVYNTATAGDVTPGYYYNDGTQWVRLANAANVGETNTTLALDSTTGLLTYTNENNNNPVLSLANIEPWFGTDNHAGATENTEDIYTMGRVAIGKDSFDRPGPLVIENNAPNGSANITLTGNTSSHIVIEAYRNSPWTHAAFRAQAGRGTKDAPAALNAGDALLYLDAQGYNGTSMGGSSSAISYIAAENFTPTANGGYMVFSTTDTGATVPTQRMRIAASGNIGIATSSPTEKLDVNGKVRVRDLTGADQATDVVVTADATTGELKEGGAISDLGSVWDEDLAGTTKATESSTNIRYNNGGVWIRGSAVPNGHPPLAVGRGDNRTGMGSDLDTYHFAIYPPSYNAYLSGDAQGLQIGTNSSGRSIRFRIANIDRFEVFGNGRASLHNYTGTNFDETNPNYVLSTDGTTGDITKTSIADLASATADGDAWGVTGEDQTSAIGRTGNVGIGTTTPASPLHIVKNVPIQLTLERSNAQDSYINYKNTGLDWTAGLDASLGFVIAEANAITTNPRFLVEAGGNVGIGTTTPNEKLEVNGKVRVSDLTGADAATDVIVTADATTGELKEGGTVASLQDGDAWGVTGEDVASNIGRTGRVAIGTTGATTATLDVRNSGTEDILNLRDGTTEVMTVLDGGNVGIGTNTPDVKLQVGHESATSSNRRLDANSIVDIIGNEISSRADSTVQDMLRLHQPNTEAGSKGSAFAIGLSFHEAITNNFPRTRVDFKTTAPTIDQTIPNRTVMSLLDNGRVGIGTTKPTASLQISDGNPTGNIWQGTADIPGMQIHSAGGDAWAGIQRNITSPNLFLTKTGAFGSGSYVLFYSGGFVKGHISTNGSTVSYNTSSDRRLKENFKPSQYGLSNILDMNVLDYTYKVDRQQKNKSTGFIAQELYKIYPQAVTKGTDEVDQNGNLVEPWAVDYGKLTPVLVKAVQDLHAELQKEKEENNTLKARLAKIEETLSIRENK